VAGRLANLDHDLQVMLIEAGESNLNNPWVFRPGIYPRNMKLDSKTASFYYSRPSEWLGGRRAVVPCAHILGGGSSINFMVRWFRMREHNQNNPLTMNLDVHPSIGLRLR
jgi:alcohol oxidase